MHLYIYKYVYLSPLYKCTFVYICVYMFRPPYRLPLQHSLQLLRNSVWVSVSEFLCQLEGNFLSRICFLAAGGKLRHTGWISDVFVYVSICISFAPLYMNISLGMYIYIFRPPHRLSTPRPLRNLDNELEFRIFLYIYEYMYLSPPYVYIFIYVYMYIVRPPHSLPVEHYPFNTLPVAKEFRQRGWVSDIVVYI